MTYCVSNHARKRYWNRCMEMRGSPPQHLTPQIDRLILSLIAASDRLKSWGPYEVRICHGGASFGSTDPKRGHIRLLVADGNTIVTVIKRKNAKDRYADWLAIQDSKRKGSK